METNVYVPDSEGLLAERGKEKRKRESRTGGCQVHTQLTAFGIPLSALGSTPGHVSALLTYLLCICSSIA